jgi:hypothetical protein
LGTENAELKRGGSSLELSVVTDVDLDMGLASNAAGDRYLNCGGLMPGVGRPLLHMNDMSIESVKALGLIISEKPSIESTSSARS